MQAEKLKDLQGRIEVVLCLGSSCYSRGNSEALTILEHAVEQEGWQDKVYLKGCTCLGRCSEGPVIVIDGTTYAGIHPDSVAELVRKHVTGGMQ